MTENTWWKQIDENLQAQLLGLSGNPNYFSFDKVHFFNLKDVEKVTVYDLKESEKPGVGVFPTEDYVIEVILKNGKMFHHAYKSHVKRNGVADEISKYLNNKGE